MARAKRPEQKPARRAPGNYKVALWVAVFVVVCAVFWPCLDNGFVNFDDPDYVSANEHVQAGLTWPSVKWAFTSSNETGNWHPVTWLSHMLDTELFGKGPRGPHATNVVLHALNAALVFSLLQTLTGLTWRSAAVALLFAVHPLRTESVAWISERKDVLAAFFGLLSCVSFSRYAKALLVPASENTKRKTRAYVLSVSFFLLSLMSKPMLVTLPFLLLLIDYWPLQRWRDLKTSFPAKLIWEKVPFVALSALFSIITLLTQRAAGAVHEQLSIGTRIQNALWSYARYLGKVVWPSDLAVYYPMSASIPVVAVILSTLLLGVLSLIATRGRRRFPYFFVGWFWFLVALLPVIGIIQAGLQAMADRYTYIPSLGLFIGMVWVVGEWLTVHVKEERTRLIFRRGLVATTGAFILLLTFVTERQIGFWKDSGTLFERALAVTDKNDMALMHLANFRREQNQLPEAIELYRQAVALDSKVEEPYVNLGVLLYVSGQKEAGLRQLQEGLKKFPRSYMLHGNLGTFLAQQGRLDEGESHIRQTLQLNPNSAEAHVELGNILLARGRRTEAIAEFREALRLRPNFSRAEQRLAAASGS